MPFFFADSQGTVRRSKDGNYVHCNVDTDVLFWDGSSSLPGGQGPIDLRLKPPELYNIIENFCQGTRRIELFGTNRNLRPGWLTVGHATALGPDAPAWQGHGEEYGKTRYDARFKVDPVGCPLAERRNVVPFSEAVDSLRPKTPPGNLVREQHAQAYPGGETEPGMAALSLSPAGPRRDEEHAHLPRGLGVGPRRNMQASPYGTGAPSSPDVPFSTASPHKSNSNNSNNATPYPYASTGHSISAGVHPHATTGLGAGGPVRVSVESGSETLSGPQRSAIGMGMGMRERQQQRGRGGGGGGRGRGRAA